MKRLISALLAVGFGATLAMTAVSVWGATPLPAQAGVTLLDLHPLDPTAMPAVGPAVLGMPTIIRRGEGAPDAGHVQLPGVITPSWPGSQGPGDAIGKAGTGFFVGDDGTLLTAAHVVQECRRMQIISKYVARTWVSLVAADRVHDVAILKAEGLRPPAVMHIAAAPPVSSKLLILGFPPSAGLTVPSETWAVMENARFPANVGSLANPRDRLWMLAPAVTHGYSGGPVFDPKLGAVVGIVKGEVDGGYLRLIRDMPTTGIAIGPGISHLGAMVGREVPYAAVSLASSPGEAGQDTLRRATVHVLCWH